MLANLASETDISDRDGNFRLNVYHQVTRPLLQTVSLSDTVKDMTMTTATRTIDLTVDSDLLEHRTHLPETIDCHCGYVRPEVPARTLGE